MYRCTRERVKKVLFWDKRVTFVARISTIEFIMQNSSQILFYFPLNWFSILEKIPGAVSSTGFLSSFSSLLGCRRKMRLREPARGWNSFFGEPSLSTSFSILPKELLFSLFVPSSLQLSTDLVGFWWKERLSLNFFRRLLMSLLNSLVHLLRSERCLTIHFLFVAENF